MTGWLNVEIVGLARRAILILALGLAPTLLGLLAACGLAHPSALNFRTDDRLLFVSPPNRSLVQPPVVIRWRISHFHILPANSAPPSRDSGYFAVFVDRPPIKPGRTMRDIAAKDEVCLHRPGCPDEAYLEERRIYTTTAPEVVLQQLPPIFGNTERVQLHAITVVLMDTAGHRIGESSWELDLRVRRPGL